MSYNRGDVAWAYHMFTGEVRPVIVLEVLENPKLGALRNVWLVLFGITKVKKYVLFKCASSAQAYWDEIQTRRAHLQNATK